jgi:hypothetical protein
VRGPLNASQWLLQGALRKDGLDGQVRSDLQDVAGAISEAVALVTRQLDEARPRRASSR